MSRPVPLLLLLCGFLMVAMALGLATSAFAQGRDRSVENVVVSRPTWHRGGGLLYGEVTIRNHNSYSLKNVIIGCDFFDEWGNQIGSKGTALRRPISPGRTRFSGLEFPVTVRNMQGGACRIVSAERLEGGPESTE